MKREREREGGETVQEEKSVSEIARPAHIRAESSAVDLCFGICLTGKPKGKLMIKKSVI